jgi:hypothetical protein
MSNSIFKFATSNIRDMLANCLPSELLYAPIDVAKYNHSAMIVNFLGDIIIPKFDFTYNNHGIDFLRNKLESVCKNTHAKKIFLALESTGHYHENLVDSLVVSGYDVAIIRPIGSKNERDNVHAKTDAKVEEKLSDYRTDDIPQDNYLVKIQHQLEEKYDITQKLS